MLMDWGLLILRVALGLIVAAHGAQKLFGWFGGGGLAGTRKVIEDLNLHPAWFWTILAALNEFVGGGLTALGLLMPLGPLMIIANMLVSIFYVHWTKGFWNTKGGIEYSLSLGLSALGLACTYAGAYSLDALWKTALPEPQTLIIGLIVILCGFLAALISGGRRVFATKRATA